MCEIIICRHKFSVSEKVFSIDVRENSNIMIRGQFKLQILYCSVYLTHSLTAEVHLTDQSWADFFSFHDCKRYIQKPTMTKKSIRSFFLEF